MLAAMISDVHLTRAEEPTQRALVAFLDALQAQRLYILGDLFHFGWDWPGVEDPEKVPVLSALQRARERGIGLAFVPGNHDFQLGPFFERRLGARVSAAFEEELGGRRALLVHGDEADLSLGYRFTRWALRGPGFAALMRALGPTRGQRLGLSLAGGSRHLGDVRPQEGPSLLDRQRAWALQRLGRDADLVVMGHSHKPCLERHPGGVFVNLGDFARDRLYLALDPEPELRRWTA